MMNHWQVHGIETFLTCRILWQKLWLTERTKNRPMDRAGNREVSLTIIFCALNIDSKSNYWGWHVIFIFYGYDWYKKMPFSITYLTPYSWGKLLILVRHICILKMAAGRLLACSVLHKCYLNFFSFVSGGFCFEQYFCVFCLFDIYLFNVTQCF